MVWIARGAWVCPRRSASIRRAAKTLGSCACRQPYTRAVLPSLAPAVIAAEVWLPPLSRNAMTHTRWRGSSAANSGQSGMSRSLAGAVGIEGGRDMQSVYRQNSLVSTRINLRSGDFGKSPRKFAKSPRARELRGDHSARASSGPTRHPTPVFRGNPYHAAGNNRSARINRRWLVCQACLSCISMGDRGAAFEGKRACAIGVHDHGLCECQRIPS